VQQACPEYADGTSPVNGAGRVIPERWRARLVVAALLGFVVYVYRDSLAVYFLNEDFTWLRCCRLRGRTGLWSLLTHDVIGGTYSWRPLLQLSFGINYAAWGMNPVGYRVASLAWHAAAAGLLYAIGRQLTDRFRACVAAAVFAVHPLQVESVSWTCARAALISTVLILWAVLAYLRWRYRGRSALPVLVAFGLALLAQESAVVAPALVLAADVVLPGRRLPAWRHARLYAALLAVMVAFFLLRHQVSPAATNLGMVGLDPRWPVTAAGLLVFLVAKMRACAVLLLTLPAAAAGAALPLAAATAAGALVLWWRGWPVALWGTLWIGIAVAPFSLLLFGPFPRYLHLALAGFGLLFAELLAATRRLLDQWDRRAATVCVALILVLWLVNMVRLIDREQAGFVDRGGRTRALLVDLLRTLPDPRAGSTLAFYGLGDVRLRQGVFVFGLSDAVRLFYGDDTLRVEFRPLGAAADDAYHLWYHDGRLDMLSHGRT
jgi:hypothetical protein